MFKLDNNIVLDKQDVEKLIQYIRWLQGHQRVYHFTSPDFSKEKEYFHKLRKLIKE